MNGYPSLDPPTTCAHCGQPFQMSEDGTHYEAWRGPDGKFFCSEFCASTADEAELLAERRWARSSN